MRRGPKIRRMIIHHLHELMGPHDSQELACFNRWLKNGTPTTTVGTTGPKNKQKAQF
jgi:hypothetical protein